MTNVCFAAKAPTLFYLNNAGQVLRVNIDGTDRRILAEKQGVGPDGIALDAVKGHIYWTNMGKASVDDGTIMRANLDGTNVITVVPAGGTFTPKQLKLDEKNRKLYWSDREGMRVLRSNLDGSKIETLVITGAGDEDRKDQSKWCVGIALDIERGKLYWTQKGASDANQGTIKRMNLEIPTGEDPARRSDIEVLFSNLPEPIDLDIDSRKQLIYWTDRGDNTISRAPLYPKAGYDPSGRKDRTVLVRGMREAIGIALDLTRNRLYYTSLSGEVGVAKLDGGGAKTLLTDQGVLTGIMLVEAATKR
ncbi:MAG: 3-hydroxyacyl-CoA dehydrogenase [Candidatus Obscuribacterales bacterium]|nr:3-hydroxyacyl-CoA dehydrogenase [Steroidobacteraceae bacterium]